MKKFNTFSGVFVPSYEAILGAVLFLILPFLTAGMGLVRMLLIVILANSATVATAFSISDCTTNLLRVDAGGMFAVSKRSLGKAFGGSIGIQLFLAQALSIGFYVIGFAEPLQAVLVQFPPVATFVERSGLSQGLQVQLIAAFVGLIAFVMALVGADFIVKIQMVIFIVLSVSVASILFSPLILRNSDLALFTTGLNTRGLGLSIGFWGAFAMFFPAVTGIDAGVGMSGQLKDPRRSLGRGTFLAIGVTFVVYVLLTLVFSLMDPARLMLPGERPVSAVQLFQSVPLMQLIILVGILFATGSSTLSYLLTAPRTAQALAREGLLPPFLNFLKYDFRRGGKEPRWATLVTVLLFMPIIVAGDIQIASTVVGISFLTVYGWVNLAAFLERISGNPSFRPTSRGHWLISLYGFLICIIGILLFNALIGLAVLLFQFTIFFLLLRYRSGNKLEGVWWGVLFKLIQWTLSRIGTIIQGTKNWRPIVRVFASADRPETVASTREMADQISRYKGLTMMNIISADEDDQGASPDHQIIHTKSGEVETSILAIAQAALPGGFQTNTILLPMDRRLNLLRIIENLIVQKKHVLLYRGKEKEPAHSNPPRIDLWWKGEGNGNLMALLAYIITQSETELWQGVRPAELQIRFIRKLHAEEERESAEAELGKLMNSARLEGSILVLPADERNIHETVHEHSKNAVLVMLGMPGEPASGFQRLFAIDERFFSRQFEVYEDMPSMLFIKASHIINLEE